MRTIIGAFVLLVLTLAASADAQQRPGQRGGNRPGRAGANPDPAAFVERLMTMDADGDGALAKEEMTDPRLQQLFARADADNDGKVTKDELTGMFAKMQKGRGAGAAFGRGGPGGPPAGIGGPDGPPMVGQVLPPPMRERLGLNSRQQKQLDALQKLVDERLEKILTAEQRAQLEEMFSRGPGGPGGPGEFGEGPGGPPGGEPGERRGRRPAGPPEGNE